MRLRDSTEVRQMKILALLGTEKKENAAAAGLLFKGRVYLSARFER